MLPTVQVVVLLLPCVVTAIRASAMLEPHGCRSEPLDNYNLTQCGGKGYALICSGANLTEVPKFNQPITNLTDPLCILDLSNNNIQKLNNNAFVNMTSLKFLYLSNNTLVKIKEKAFKGLGQLEYLNLTINKLQWPGSFENRTFKQLEKLKSLDLKGNQISTFKKLDESLMSTASLESLSINGCPNCSFGEKFRNLSHLRNISLSGELHSSCRLSYIDNKMFTNVPQITGLWISHCHIEHIDKDAFTNLLNLEILDFSKNEKLEFKGMNTALHGLQNHTKLKVLNVNGIHELIGRGTILRVSHIENLKTLKALETLHMDVNKLEVFDSDIFYPKYQLPLSLRNLTLCGNRLTIGKYSYYLLQITNITSLDISWQHLMYALFHRDFYDQESYITSELYTSNISNTLPRHDDTCSNDEFFIMIFPPALRFLKWRKSFVYLPHFPNIFVLGGTNIEYFDLSFNLVLKWSGKIVGLDSLTHLDLSDNICDYVASCFFEFPKLKYLNISGNRLAESLGSKGADRLFNQMSELEILDMSRNHIHFLPSNIFKYQGSLKVLVLSINNLDTADFRLNKSTCMQRLDLSSNKLKELPEGLMHDVDTINEQCNHPVNISMVSNPVECTCDTLDFLNWMLNTKSSIHFNNTDYCYMKHHERRRLDNKHIIRDVVNQLEKECQDIREFTWLVVLCTVIITISLTVLVCSILYRYRWKLRYLYYNRNRRHAPEGFERLFENDCFVSYPTNLCSFIKNQAVPNLEHNHELKVWAADRNSSAGTPMAEDIVHAISNSRKSILFIDQHYMKDTWCDYEMNMARMESIESKRSVIIFVLFDDVPLSVLPKGLFKSLEEEPYFRYITEASPQDDAAFWTDLAAAVMA